MHTHMRVRAYTYTHTTGLWLSWWSACLAYVSSAPNTNYIVWPGSTSFHPWTKEYEDHFTTILEPRKTGSIQGCVNSKQKQK